MAQNIEELLGTAITEYTPNAIKFRGLSLETLQQIFEARYTTRSANFNAAPSVGSFIEFGQRYQRNGVTVTFDGIAFADRESPNLVVDAITVQDLRKDTRYRVGSNKLHTNTWMFEFLNQGIREPLVLQLVKR